MGWDDSDAGGMEQRRTILDVLAATDAELAHAQPDPNHRYTVDEFFH